MIEDSGVFFLIECERVWNPNFLVVERDIKIIVGSFPTRSLKTNLGRMKLKSVKTNLDRVNISFAVTLGREIFQSNNL